MNPFKWFARWILAKELSGLRSQITVQEAEITRLMAMIRKDGSEAAAQIGNLHIANRGLANTNDMLSRMIDAALEVHDKAKSPNSTVKRMARILRAF